MYKPRNGHLIHLEGGKYVTPKSLGDEKRSPRLLTKPMMFWLYKKIGLQGSTEKYRKPTRLIGPFLSRIQIGGDNGYSSRSPYTWPKLSG